jgi:lipoyl(octanoyl) transferase
MSSVLCLISNAAKMIEIEDWGLIDYNEAWERQKKLVSEIQEKRDKNVLVVCQHPTVITIGKTGKKENVLSNINFLEKLGVQVIDIDRGGDVTLHNPGQLVGYPIFNLSSYKEDLHWFLREIEDRIIKLLKIYGINSGRIAGLTGVWVEGRRKICAIGMHCSRWVISHGFALNVNNNLTEFNYIVPCGIIGKEVTSIKKEIGTNIEYDDVKNNCLKIFAEHF